MLGEIPMLAGALGGSIGTRLYLNHRSIDYKKRWQEATRLLEEERLGTNALEAVTKPAHTNPWKVKAEPSPGRGYMYIYIVSGQQKIKVQEVNMYPQGTFDRRMIEATKIARRSAAALDV